MVSKGRGKLTKKDDSCQPWLDIPHFSAILSSIVNTSLFDYPLPPDRIAQSPMEPREAAQLLVVDRSADTLTDQHIADLPRYLRAGDLLVVNDSRVFKARLTAIVEPTKKEIEIFLLRPLLSTTWLALAKPGRALEIGTVCRFTDHLTATVTEKREDGTIALDFGISADQIFTLTDLIGQVPLPPYIESHADDEAYQTVYAKERGSVAAPTAGFHLTKPLLAQLETMGVRLAFVTLHVGLGTFRPMKSTTLAEHEMHEEWLQVSQETVDAIQQTKQRGGRVIAVGTTTVRALESAAQTGDLKPFNGFTKLFITPGYTFRVIDGLLTNFHLPKSTLIVLVSALAGRERILKAYQHAIEHGYRFFSFGDAMLIM